MISNENLLISGKLLLYGNTREPPAKISSVDILSPIFSRIGRRKSFGSASISGIEATFGPLLNFTCFASSYGRGASNKFTSFALCFGIFIFGTFPLYVRGSVILPVSAEAAAVSGEHKYTLSSFVPERPGKFLGVVRRLFLPVAGACPIPIHPLQPA